MQENELGVPVCLDVKLSLQNQDRYSTGSSIVEVQPLPNKTASVADYLAAVMPKTKVEFLGRHTLLFLDEDSRRKFSPTSLFFDTVHRCFQNHYPLALRPEVLMYLIVNEVATTINMYPEQYRHLFTTSAEKVELHVINDALRIGDPDSPWHEVLEDFNVKLREQVPGNLAPSFLSSFSTSTIETDTATTVAFMSAVREFYDFHTHTRCGLPQIRLLGETKDYTKLREATEHIAGAFSQGHLYNYFGALIPVLKKIEQQALGAPIDIEFWSSLYTFRSNSGTAAFNGWIAAFVNYVQVLPWGMRGDAATKAGTIEAKKAGCYDWKKQPDYTMGIHMGSVPAQISVAPFTWHYFEKIIPMQFVGGVLGIENIDGYATPALSYAITNAS